MNSPDEKDWAESTTRVVQVVVEFSGRGRVERVGTHGFRGGVLSRANNPRSGSDNEGQDNWFNGPLMRS